MSSKLLFFVLMHFISLIINKTLYILVIVMLIIYCKVILELRNKIEKCNIAKSLSLGLQSPPRLHKKIKIFALEWLEKNHINSEPVSSYVLYIIISGRSNTIKNIDERFTDI